MEKSSLAKLSEKNTEYFQRMKIKMVEKKKKKMMKTPSKNDIDYENYFNSPQLPRRRV